MTDVGVKGQGGKKKTCHQGEACKTDNLVTVCFENYDTSNGSGGNRHDRVANIVHTVFLGICSIHVKVRRRYECREEETGNNNTPYVS